MAEQLFEIKYQPKSLSEIIGNEATAERIRDYLKREEHRPILISGPSGCGKTTLAMIIKKELGLDVIGMTEINAATMSMETIRHRIIAMTGYSPLGKWRVYLLEEAHLLTSKEQAALLKELEGARKENIFIFCTTKPEKISHEVKRRCLGLTVSTLSKKQILQLLNGITQKEKGKATPKVLQKIADVAQGYPSNALRILGEVIKENEKKALQMIAKGRDLVSRKGDFELRPIKELLEKEPEKISFLWGEILTQNGLNLLVSRPKVGKSIFALNLAASVAQGKNFLGFPTSKGPVVYLALEESEDQVVNISRSLGVPPDAKIFFHFGLAAERDPVDGIARIIADNNPKLVIIDPLHKLLRDRKLKDYASMSSGLDPFNALARERKCCILFAHHLTKKGEEIIGSIAVAGGVDNVIYLIKRKQGEEFIRTFRTEQRYGKPIEEETLLSMNDNYSLSREATLAEISIQRTWEAIEPLLTVESESEDGAGLTIQQILKETGCQSKDIVDTLKWAIEKGKVVRTGSGRKGDPFKNYLSKKNYKNKKTEK